MDVLSPMANLSNATVVITGIGPITAMGVGVTSLWNAFEHEAAPSIVTQRSTTSNGGRSYYRIYSPTPEMLADLDVPSVYLQRLQEWYGERFDPDHITLIQTINLALEDSGLSYDEDENNVSLFLLHENPGIEKFFSDCLDLVFDAFVKTGRSEPSLTCRQAQESKEAFRAEVYKHMVQDTYNLQPFMFLYALVRTFRFHGYSLYVNNACASGLFAMESAYRQITSGQSQVAIVAGIDWPSRYLYKNLWFDWEGLYSTSEAIKPFSRERDGFILGDAACAIVFEDFEHAQARRAHVYGEYVGGGFDLEGWKVTVPAGSPDSYVRAVRRAMERCNVSGEEIDLINPHGVSTSVGDAYESKGLHMLFGSSLKDKIITNLKPYLGHTLGVCGLVETVILLLMLERQYVVGTLNAKSTAEALLIESRRVSGNTTIRHALKISAGFAGYNGAAIFRAATAFGRRR